MKLIIKQYLSSLRERDELDAILPALLSQMGLNVFSRPGKGTRQDGVDVAAVGKIDGGEEKVYLFSLKQGDLTRSSWDGQPLQSLRPSLNEILDSYIPNRLPDEHKTKDIVICISLGGDIQEQVRLDVEGFITQNTEGRISFEEWNGDKLASLIETYFLREDLLPENVRTELRKSLALLDEPESSFQHFSILIKSLASKKDVKVNAKLMTLRQLNICLWILYTWARDINNLESAYLSSELVILNAWEIAKPFYKRKTKSSRQIHSAFDSILTLYFQISSEYSMKILPHTYNRHSISVAVNTSCSLDVNLRLFDILGRLALSGIWACYASSEVYQDNSKYREIANRLAKVFSNAVKQLILNNPVLSLPIKDDQAIDISFAVFLLLFDQTNHDMIYTWLDEIVSRAAFSFKTQGQYPCILQNYSELLDHPDKNDEEYQKKVTGGSILFPSIAFWAAMLGNENLYNHTQVLKNEFLKHCNFQFWYPDETSEQQFYNNNDIHGAVLSNVCIDRSSKEYLDQIFGECEHSPQYRTLSAVKNGLWPLILVACRHYRIPVPIHLWQSFREPK